jgi:hypothetical protein
MHMQCTRRMNAHADATRRSSTRSACPSSNIAVAPARSTPPRLQPRGAQPVLPCKPASLLCPVARDRRRHGSTDSNQLQTEWTEKGFSPVILEITSCNLHSDSTVAIVVAIPTTYHTVPQVHEHVHIAPYYSCTCAVQPRPKSTILYLSTLHIHIHMQAPARSASPN